MPTTKVQPAIRLELDSSHGRAAALSWAATGSPRKDDDCTVTPSVTSNEARPSRPQAPPVVEQLTAAQTRRRQRIVDAAIDLLMNRRYDRIQMRDVAADAGVALGTLYRYFSSKEHLFAAVLRAWADRLDERVSRRPLRGATNTERMVELVSRAARSFELAPHFFEAWRAVAASTDPHARDITVTTGDRTRSIYLRALDGVDADTSESITLCCEALLDFTLFRWYNGRLSTDDVYRDLARGVTTILETSIRH
jgi:AcrR family transcriptional regulator